ncbi:MULTISPECIES: ABC transporter permease [unclassified Mesorhizobium]|uniref:ABC transporter permease n=4 Tax=Mesorhizobium TaxID=68287 RepID=UPI000485005A|nr:MULTISPECIES: ABC transporter permease [unclassified Mesorhizobium]RUZ70716.1 ABC transporter permease [Mesorhizobium sp. M7A.F.Ca.US.003.02.2.1]RVA26258.1 ABC transporter permease [Mesorhizobium sp. M7A.F.Ca.US.001.01.1.1]ARP68384.1 ABC transporter permease [Mesorhizobium sp. WSM1497]MBZ9887440.1 ABC transporter permease [Mesorhizobium sp. BR1-1-3]RUX69340.1 ABC transporter permease [Mesorhizobium sp. M7A.F.Ca.US.005.03.1.1]
MQGSSFRRSSVAGLPAGSGSALPALLLVGLFFIVPVVALLLRSVTDPEPGLQNYAALFGSDTYVRVFLNTFLVASVVTAVTILVAFPVAWMLAIMPPAPGSIVFGIIILSMWTNLLTRTYAWMVLLQRTGVINRALMGLGIIHEPLPLINNLAGVTIGMVYIMLPFMILPLVGTLRAIDPMTLRAAALCGASPSEAFRRILLPLSLPGIAAGGLMVFVMSLGYFVTPALLGGTSNMMLAEMIAQTVQSLLNWGLGSAAAFVLLVVTMALYAIQLRLVGARRAGGGL